MQIPHNEEGERIQSGRRDAAKFTQIRSTRHHDLRSDRIPQVVLSEQWLGSISFFAQNDSICPDGFDSLEEPAQRRVVRRRSWSSDRESETRLQRPERIEEWRRRNRFRVGVLGWELYRRLRQSRQPNGRLSAIASILCPNDCEGLSPVPVDTDSREGWSAAGREIRATDDAGDVLYIDILALLLVIDASAGENFVPSRLPPSAPNIQEWLPLRWRLQYGWRDLRLLRHWRGHSWSGATANVFVGW
jgi:hypothetical protein